MDPRDNSRIDDDERGPGIGRRKFLAVGGAIATTLVAGCSGGGTGDSSGTFQLYISDQPLAIDEFDSLDVTIDGARLFRAEADSDESGTTIAEATTDGAETTDSTTEGTATTEATMDETTTTGPTTDETTYQTEEPSDDGGYIEIDVDDETVDLTTVTGEKAIGIFDGEVPEGRYSSVHISVSQVDGVVDGEAVDVELPSDRLKIVKPFELTDGESVQFVFDITVVKKGQSGGYNLLPVVGESGVVGDDVGMEEVDPGEVDGGTATETTSD